MVLGWWLTFYLWISPVVGGYPLDLRVYLRGGAAILHGEALYSPAVSEQGSSTVRYGFTYPPFAADLFAGPSRWPVLLDLVLVLAVSLACLALLVRYAAPCLLRRAWDGRSWLAVLVVVAVLSCDPVRENLLLGQVNLVLAAFAVLDVSERTPRPVRGALIGVAAGIKLVPAIFVAYLLLRRRFADAARAVAAFLVTVGIGWLVSAPDSHTYWFHDIYSPSRTGDTSRPSNQSVYGMVERLVPNHHVRAVLWVLGVLVVLALGASAALRCVAAGREPLAVAIVGVVGCLVTPVAWTHHWVWCVPLVLGSWDVVRERTAGRWLLAVAVVFFLIGTEQPPLTSTYSVGPGRWILENGFVLLGLAVIGYLWRVAAAGRDGGYHGNRPPGLHGSDG